MIAGSSFKCTSLPRARLVLDQDLCFWLQKGLALQYQASVKIKTKKQTNNGAAPKDRAASYLPSSSIHSQKKTNVVVLQQLLKHKLKHMETINVLYYTMKALVVSIEGITGVAALTGTRIRSPSDLSHKLCLANWINYRSMWVLSSRGWIRTNTQELLSFTSWTLLTGCMCFTLSLQEEVEVWWLTYKAGDGAMKIFCLAFVKKRPGERIMPHQTAEY